jgi:hypothetical protein
MVPILFWVRLLLLAADVAANATAQITVLLAVLAVALV